MDVIERNNWLAHRWPIKKRTEPYGGWTMHIAEIDGQRISRTPASSNRGQPVSIVAYVPDYLVAA